MKAPTRVLVVDDSATVRLVPSTILEQKPGIVVTTAPNPIMTLGMLQKDGTDVILLDNEIPHTNGLT